MRRHLNLIPVKYALELVKIGVTAWIGLRNSTRCRPIVMETLQRVCTTVLLAVENSQKNALCRLRMRRKECLSEWEKL